METVDDYATLATPIGELVLVQGSLGLKQIRLPGEAHRQGIDKAWRLRPAALRTAIAQLRAYFAGELRVFELELEPAGTPFQLSVWHALLEVPYGETTSYGQIAQRIGRPSASRAVGAANGRNPLPIIVPCHRIIGTSGQLVGYGGGLPAKRHLLDLEGASHSRAKKPKSSSLPLPFSRS